MSRVVVRGHRTWVQGSGSDTAHTNSFTIWEWHCLSCGQHGTEMSWRFSYADADYHARRCNKKPIRLVYAVRLPNYMWYTDPCFVQGIPGTDGEAEVEASFMAVRYMDFPHNAPRDRQAAVVVKVASRSGVLRVLDMTPAAAMAYRQAWLTTEQSM